LTRIEPEITVLGAQGFVGSHLVRDIAGKGLRCYVPTRGSEAIFRRPLGHVIYCVGLTADYSARPFDTVEAHVSYYARILRDADFKSMTYLSSTRLYDSGDGDGVETSNLTLNPHNARHLYDFSKGLGEVLGLTCGRDNVRVARLASVYADDLVGENFLHNLVRRALAASRITLETCRDSARDYVHIDDVCAGLLAIAREGKQSIYNLASGINVRNDTLFELIERASGCHINAIGEGVADRAPSIDISALRKDLGIKPRALKDALPSIIAGNIDSAPLQRAAS